MHRVVLLLPTATYRANDFAAAASTVGVEVVVASDRRQAMADTMEDRALVVPFDDPPSAAAAVVELARRNPVDAVIAVDEAGVVTAALAAAELGLAHNPPRAVMATRDKSDLRHRLALAGIPQPRFRVIGPADDAAELAAEVGFPCVVKPVSLSGSRGVIRADSGEEATAAAARIRTILRESDAGTEAPPDPFGPLLVESFVPGVEVAVEGLLTDGRLRVLAAFDKPEPMDGPYFAETILVTPSRLPAPILAEIESVTGRAATALGLREGPVHAELRVDPARGEVTFLEIAARSIGGLCSRTLRFGTGMSLEEVLLRHAVGADVPTLDREDRAAGVLMLSAPRSGTLRSIEGIEAARAVPGIEDIELTVRPGASVRPLPDDARYLGFVFARGDDPPAVEAALVSAWSEITIVVRDA